MCLRVSYKKKYDPDPNIRGTDSRIRSRTNMSRIPNTAKNNAKKFVKNEPVYLRDELSDFLLTLRTIFPFKFEDCVVVCSLHHLLLAPNPETEKAFVRKVKFCHWLEPREKLTNFARLTKPQVLWSIQ
jgi:hypothetical protein